MAIGDNPFMCAFDHIEQMISQHGVLYQVDRTNRPVGTTSGINTNIYGTPVDDYGEPIPPDLLMVELIITNVKVDEEPTEAGGKTKEIIEFTGRPGSILLSDEIHYGSHVYKVDQAPEAPLGKMIIGQMGRAWREVDA